MAILRDDDGGVPDRDLVRRAKAGDTTAFDDMCRKYWRPVYLAAMGALHWDKDAADDATLETFVEVTKNGLDDFDEDKPLLPYLRTIARRRAMDQVRPRSAHVSVQYVPEVPDTVMRDVVAGEVLSREHVLALTRALDVHLSDVERQLFPLWLQEVSGHLSRTDVVRALGWSADYTATRVGRMRRTLKHAGMAMALVHNGEHTCPGFAELAPVPGQPPASWPALAAHVRSCADCRHDGGKLFRADRILPAMAVALVAMAETAGERGGAAVRAAATDVFVPVAPAPAGAAGGGIGPAIGKKLVVVGSTGAAVVAGLLLLTPGVLLPDHREPGAGQPPPTVSAAPQASGTTVPPGSSSSPSAGVPVPPPGSPAPGGPTADVPGPGQGGTTPPTTSETETPLPPVDPTWGHWQVRWASDPGTRELTRSAAHPGNEETNWTAGDWRADRKAAVTRTSAGRYVVVLPDVGRPGGLVHVTANDLGATGVFCQPVRWWQQGADEAVEVACFTRTGAFADTPFTGLFVVGAERQPVTRTGVGQYRLGASPAVLQVTPVGAAPRHCTGSGQVVRCTDPTGALADTDLVVTGASTATLVPGHPHGANQRVDSAPVYQWLSRSGTATVTRTGTGRYTVRVPVGTLPSYTHVTGSGPGYCTLVSRNDIGANDTVLAVGCYTATGAAEDGAFHLSYVTTSVYS